MRSSDYRARRLAFTAFVVGLILLLACTCGLWVFDVANERPPAGAEQTEAPDGDCDEGDLYESKPDPDCGGRWYGTPAPSPKKTPGAVKPSPRKVQTVPTPKKKTR